MKGQWHSGARERRAAFRLISHASKQSDISTSEATPDDKQHNGGIQQSLRNQDRL